MFIFKITLKYYVQWVSKKKNLEINLIIFVVNK